MPILLTTPYDPGSSDPGETYPRAKITGFSIDLHAKVVQVRLEYGDVVDGSWVRGKASLEPSVCIENKPAEPGPATTDYDDLVAELPEAEETIYAGAARVLYEYLIAKGILSGTIE
jgi:hypothetical protein